MQKLLTKFPGVATSGHHNPAIITDAENSLPNALYRKPSQKSFIASSVNTYHISNAYVSQSHAASHRRLLSHVTLCLIRCSK